VYHRHEPGPNPNRKHDKLQDVFEMGNQTDLRVQIPEAVHIGTHWDDSNSDEVIFGTESGKGAIVETASVRRKSTSEDTSREI